MEPMEMTAEGYLAALKTAGVDVVFANSGTDFASIVEALARRLGSPRYPRFVTVPHENLAMAMAYGYYRTTGRMAGVMVHVSVGTANTICGLMNAARDNVPILLAAGRTPLTEQGHPASRNRTIHWGQECFDQGALVREFVKWDYELRGGQPVADVVGRAVDIAMSEPRGPVYLTLPREVLAEPSFRAPDVARRTAGLSAGEPRQGDIAEAAKLIAGAKFPLIVTTSGGRTAEGFAALAELATAAAIPVVQWDARILNMATSHPMNLGFELTSGLMNRADLILAVEAPVPWLPSVNPPPVDAKVIAVGADPLAQRLPFHGFKYDLAIAADTALALTRLGEALAPQLARLPGRVAERREEVAALRQDLDARRRDSFAAAARQTPISVRHIAACLNALKAPDAIVVSELGVAGGALDLEVHGTFINASLAGGLGLGLGAALGAKLGASAREVIVATGDGSYMFGNPLPYHFVQRAEALPTLTIVCNNAMWFAVRQSTVDVYPKGKAVEANEMPLVHLSPSPDYEKTILTCGGYGEKVEDPAELMAAMRRCFDAVRCGRPALLNVITQGR